MSWGQQTPRENHAIPFFNYLCIYFHNIYLFTIHWFYCIHNRIETQLDLTLFFSYLLTCELNPNEVLEIMAQIGPYPISFKPETKEGDFRLYFELFEKGYRL